MKNLKTYESFEPEEYWEDDNEFIIEPNKHYVIKKDYLRSFLKILNDNGWSVEVNDKPFTPDEIPKLLLNILNMRGDTIYITTLILGGKKMLQYGVMSDSMIKNYKNREDFVFLI